MNQYDPGKISLKTGYLKKDSSVISCSTSNPLASLTILFDLNKKSLK